METSEKLPQDQRTFLRQRTSVRTWFKSGEPWIWLTATAVGACIVAVLGLVGLIAFKGLAHFWPTDVVSIEYNDELGTNRLAGEVVQREFITPNQYAEANPSAALVDLKEIERWMLKTGNRKVNPPDFRWVYRHDITKLDKDQNMVVFERTEWGNAYGTLVQVLENDEVVETADLWEELSTRIDRATELRERAEEIQKGEINRINFQIERIRLRERERQLQGINDVEDLETERLRLNDQYKIVEAELRSVNRDLGRDQIEIRIADGRTTYIPLEGLVRAWQPNSMSALAKLAHYFSSIWIFLSEDSREANTEGGVFPALFGTVLMVLLMSVLVTPFGVIAALYLREYAKQGVFVQLIRIAVNNLAGVPSIVYGVFGLGFFVYLVGGTIDDLFFEAAQPAPTFGTPGLIWASLTLSLLTVPVVIVSTEEGLTRIPSEIREGSLALGATKAETLYKIILPMASPSILTGIILAIARAAGEVAPLMLVGVVKLAPTLPIDGNFPFLHLERKFMHLGFHIYDVGFQSPNVDAARPLVFATALLLILIIIALNMSAITLRNRLEARYRGALM